MKNKFYVIAFIVSAFAFSTPTLLSGEAEVTATQEKDKSAEISFKEKDYNFGAIPEKGGAVTHFFEFTNTGDAPLVILSATASCGCTRPAYPTDPIAPGKTGKIKITYLPDGRPGEFDKMVKVKTNAKITKKVILRIKGTVVPQ